MRFLFRSKFDKNESLCKRITCNTNLICFSVPGIADRLEENLRFKQKYLDMSGATVDKIIKSHLKKIKSKKKRKKLQKELISVGIHVRYELKKYKSKIKDIKSDKFFGVFFAKKIQI